MPIHPKAKVSAKDFFLYLAMAVTLYVSAVALIGLWFSYINFLFPDPVRYYGGFSGEGARGWMATLIIAFPLFIVFARFVNEAIRKEKEKSELWVRKWLLYLTLFVAGGTLAVDLVVLLSAFLGGETTTEFMLKVLVVFVVAGGIFGYFLASIRGFWEKREKESIIYGSIAGIVILVSIVLGFVFFGSPQTQRLLRLDDRKISDLQSIQWQVVEYWQNKGSLPENLEVIADDDLRGFRIPVDPETGESYGYEERGERTFALCADFNLPSQDLSNVEDFPSAPIRDGITIENTSWEHPAGNHCFERTIDPDFFKPRD